MRGKVSMTDYAQVFAADTATNEVHASFVVVASFTALLSSALHKCRAIYAGNAYESNTCSKEGAIKME